MMNFIEKVFDRPAVASALYGIAIMVVSLLAGVMSIFYGSSNFGLMGAIVISVVATVLPFTFLRFYSFGTFANLVESLKLPTFFVFALLEAGFIITNLTVYVTATSGEGGGWAIFILSIGNIVGAVIFGIIAAVLKIWQTISNNTTSINKTNVEHKEMNNFKNEFDEMFKNS